MSSPLPAPILTTVLGFRIPDIPAGISVPPPTPRHMAASLNPIYIPFWYPRKGNYKPVKSCLQLAMAGLVTIS